MKWVRLKILIRKMLFKRSELKTKWTLSSEWVNVGVCGCVCVGVCGWVCVCGGGVESGLNCWGVPRSCYSCFTWMYLECPRDLACPPSLSRYRLPVFSVSEGLSLWLNGFLAGNRETELKPITFSSLQLFRVFLFPLLLIPQRYNTFEFCLLGLLHNNNNIYIYTHTYIHLPIYI